VSEGEGGSCVFCQVVAGEVPSQEVYSSELAYAFQDRHPVAPVHVLVVPRQHIADASSLGPEHAALLAEMLRVARVVAERQGIRERGYRLVLNVGADAGAEVPHLHLHVLGGRRLGWPPG